MQNPVVSLGARRGRSELERVYRQDGPRLQRAITLFTGNRDVADDAVAEAFAQALRRGDAIRSPLAWVWRAAFRIAAGEMKERRSIAESTEPGSDGSYSQAEPAFDLIKALAKLSPKQRGAVILHHYAGYPTREVAQILGSTTAAVTVHLSAGRRRLRELLEDPDA